VYLTVATKDIEQAPEEPTVGERESPRSERLKKPKSERHLLFNGAGFRETSRSTEVVLRQSEKMLKSKSERRACLSEHKDAAALTS
jgi:hypothetical protein